MIGFYVHHHGVGHRVRAARIASEVSQPVFGTGTGPAPVGWPGPWVELPPPGDEERARGSRGARRRGVRRPSPTLGGVRERAAVLSGAIATHRPDLLVVDVSVEATLLARLQGVPVVVVAQPGVRDDLAHRLAYRVARASIAPWPAWVTGAWRPGPGVSATPVGAIGPSARPSCRGVRRDGDVVVLLVGRGVHGFDDSFVTRLARCRPSTRFHLLGDVGGGTSEPNVVVHGWVDDVDPHLARAGVVVTHAGQTTIATVAASRSPAVVVPQERPFVEQQFLARVLGERGLAEVLPSGADADAVVAAIETARGGDGGRWGSWDDGLGAVRAAGLVEEAAAG